MTAARLKKMVRKAILWPDINVVSSQTLYEALLGCIDLYETTGNDFWAQQSGLLARLIGQRQNPDGGFNIGFQFVFGTNVFKNDPNESTAPELLSLYALYKYREVFNDRFLDEVIEKAVDWIVRFAYETDDGKYAIPYAPYSVGDAHIVNGTSFALPGLAYYCRNNPQDKKALSIVRGMVEFLKDELEASPDGKGMYFRYFHRGSENFAAEGQQRKIDNYHIAQQIRYHCAVQALLPAEDNLFIVKNLSAYLLSCQDKTTGIIEYCNKKEFYPRDIHVWGFASCIKGFASAYVLLGQPVYRQAAEKVLNWLIEHAWNGRYFYPVLDKNGSVVDDEYYVRSEAWAFHGFAHYLKYVQFDKTVYEICQKTYRMIHGCHFSGYDNHIWNKRLIHAVRIKKNLFGEKAVV